MTIFSFLTSCHTLPAARPQEDPRRTPGGPQEDPGAFLLGLCYGKLPLWSHQVSQKVAAYGQRTLASHAFTEQELR